MLQNVERLVLHQIRRERCPGVAVLGVSMQQDDNMTGTAGAHEDFRALRTVNGRGVKARRQGRLGLARGRSNGKEHSGKNGSKDGSKHGPSQEGT